MKQLFFVVSLLKTGKKKQFAAINIIRSPLLIWMNQNYQTTASHFSCVTNIWIWLHPDALHITTAPTCDCQTSVSDTSEKQGFARLRCWATRLRPSGGGWGRVLDTNLCSQMSLRTWCVHSQCYCHVDTHIYIKIDILHLCKINFLVTRPTLSNQHWGLLKRRSCLLGERTKQVHS